MSNFFDDFNLSSHNNHKFVAAKQYLKIAKNIENIMLESGINNTKLADLLGCSKSNVTKILKGDTNLTIETLAKISIALNAELKTVLIPKSAMVELNRQALAFIHHIKSKNEENSKRAWLSTVKSSNDEAYGFNMNAQSENENVNACFP